MTEKPQNLAGALRTPEDWRRLHTVAAQVRALEPWLWMEELDIFGIQDPQSQMVLFVSVMGMLGEHFAVAVYPGTTELARFWKTANSSDMQRPDLLLDVRHAQVVFGAKSALLPEERAMIKQWGLVHKGRHAWPSFQSYRPGYFPWVADAEEARWLLLAMEQLLVMSPRTFENPALLRSAPGPNDVLVRRPDTGAAGGWREEYCDCPPPTHQMHVVVPGAQIEQVRALTQNVTHWEVSLFPMPIRIGPRGERPQLPYALLAVDAVTLIVYGVELLAAQECLEAIRLEAPAKLLNMLARCPARPATITVDLPWLGTLLGPMCQALSIRLQAGPLPALHAVRYDMEQGLAR